MKLKEIKQQSEDISKTAPNGDESLVFVNGTPLDIHFNNVKHGNDSWVDISFSSNIGQIIKNSKPMPAEFAKLVNDNFWELVDSEKDDDSNTNN